MSKMLWVAMDVSGGEVWSFDGPPVMSPQGRWVSGDDGVATKIADNVVMGLQPGECRAFVEFAPRVADGGEPASLCWSGHDWIHESAICAGDIILPMTPDPMPYLTQVDPNAARRDEIRAQIAALQAEFDGMEG